MPEVYEFVSGLSTPEFIRICNESVSGDPTSTLMDTTLSPDGETDYRRFRNIGELRGCVISLVSLILVLWHLISTSGFFFIYSFGFLQIIQKTHLIFCYFFSLLKITFFQTEEKIEWTIFLPTILVFFLDIWFDLLVLGNVPIITITLCSY